MTDARKIAASLSEAMKQAMIHGQCAADPSNGACLCALPERAILWDIGLVERKGTTAIWRTALGSEVRAVLIEEQSAARTFTGVQSDD